MRTFMDSKDWIGKWIAGFSGVAAGKGSNALVYLMKVGFAFKSQMELWFSDKIPEQTKRAKLAQTDKFGDIYQPNNQTSGEFAAKSYIHPVKNHVHVKKEDWHKDINYNHGCKDRKPALLVGNPDYTFLWNNPMIFYKDCLHRGQKKNNLLMSFIKQLSEVRTCK